MSTSQFQGTVKWFNGDKGYGFLSRSTGADVFVHVSEVQKAGLRTLREGEKVGFDVEKNPKNQKEAAVNIVVIR